MPRRRYTEQEFRTAIDDPEVRTLADLCRALGLVPRGANFESVRSYAHDLDIDADQVLACRRSGGSPSRNHFSYDDEDLLRALDDPNIDGYPALCRALGLRPLSTTYRRLRRRAESLDRPIPLDWSRVGPRRQALAERQASAWPTREELATAVHGAASVADSIRALGRQPTNAAYRWIKAALAAYDIDTAHFRPYSRTNAGRRPPLSELLVYGRTVQTSNLRQRLIEEQVLPHRCAQCGLSEWNGRPIPLELDHIDGDRLNNLLDNLRLLCPNCHAQTPTYRGRNIGRADRGRATTEEAPYEAEDVP